MSTRRTAGTMWRAAVAISLVAAGACSEGDERPGRVARPPGGDPTEPFMAYARCLRSHAIDVPDPTFTPEGGMALDDLPAPDAPGHAEAQEACKHLGGISIVSGAPVVSGRRR